MNEPNEELAEVWKALGDPTRRAILDLLRERPRTTGELAAAFPSSRFAVMKHLEVLVSGGLVISRKQGRERWNHLNAVPLRRLYERWVRPYEDHWAEGLLRLKDHLETERGETMIAEAKGVADVDRAAIGQVELEVEIAAPRERVWRALVEETGRWWRQDFYTVANPAGYTIEPWVGGRMFEHAEDGAGVLWATVVAIQPGRSIDFVGHLTAAFGGPTVTMLRLALEEKDGATVLQVSDSLLGRVSEKSLTMMKDGWWQLFGEGLKPYVEGGEE